MANSYEQQLRRIFERHIPDKVGQEKKFLEKYEGKEEKLIASLEAKYGKAADQPVPTADERGSGSDTHAMEQRLRRMFEQYLPDKVGQEKTYLEKYRGKEETLFANLEAKYGSGKAAASSSSTPNSSPRPGSRSTSASPLSERSRIQSQNHEQRLRAYFEHFVPDKVGQERNYLDQYKGNEAKLFDKLETKYGKLPEQGTPVQQSSDATAGNQNSHEQRLRAYFEHFVPDKVGQEKTYLEKYKGNEAKLFANLETKYGKLPEQSKPAQQSMDSSVDNQDHEQRLRAYFEHFIPDKVGQEKTYLEKYKGNEAKLFANLETKYGTLPSMAQTSTTSALSVPLTGDSNETISIEQVDQSAHEDSDPRVGRSAMSVGAAASSAVTPSETVVTDLISSASQAGRETQGNVGVDHSSSSIMDHNRDLSGGIASASNTKKIQTIHGELLDDPLFPSVKFSEKATDSTPRLDQQSEPQPLSQPEKNTVSMDGEEKFTVAKTESHEDRLRRIFQRSRPDKVGQEKDYLAKYKGKEENFFTALEAKYGKFPSDADSSRGEKNESSAPSPQDLHRILTQLPPDGLLAGILRAPPPSFAPVVKKVLADHKQVHDQHIKQTQRANAVGISSAQSQQTLNEALLFSDAGRKWISLQHRLLLNSYRPKRPHDLEYARQSRAEDSLYRPQGRRLLQPICKTDDYEAFLRQRQDRQLQPIQSYDSFVNPPTNSITNTPGLGDRGQHAYNQGAAVHSSSRAFQSSQQQTSTITKTERVRREVERLRRYCDHYNVPNVIHSLIAAQHDHTQQRLQAGTQNHEQRLRVFFQHFIPEKVGQEKIYLEKNKGSEAKFFAALEAKYGKVPEGGTISQRQQANAAASNRSDNNSYEQRLHAIFQQHVPDKVGQEKVYLEKYKGNEEKLFALLEKKYGKTAVNGDVEGEGHVQTKPPGSSTSSPAPLSYRDRAIAMFEHYAPNSLLVVDEASTDSTLPANTATAEAQQEEEQASNKPNTPKSYEERLRQIFEHALPEKVGQEKALLERYQGNEEKLLASLEAKYGKGIPSSTSSQAAATTDQNNQDANHTSATAGAAGADDDSMSYESRLQRCIDAFLPKEKQEPGLAQKLLKKHEGSEEKVIKAMVSKYGNGQPEPPPPTPAAVPVDQQQSKPDATTTEPPPVRKKKDYSKVDSLLTKYQGREEDLIQALVKRFGPEPSSPSSHHLAREGSPPPDAASTPNSSPTPVHNNTNNTSHSGSNPTHTQAVHTNATPVTVKTLAEIIEQQLDTYCDDVITPTPHLTSKGVNSTGRRTQHDVYWEWLTGKYGPEPSQQHNPFAGNAAANGTRSNPSVSMGNTLTPQQQNSRNNPYADYPPRMPLPKRQELTSASRQRKDDEQPQERALRMKAVLEELGLSADGEDAKAVYQKHQPISYRSSQKMERDIDRATAPGTPHEGDSSQRAAAELRDRTGAPWIMGRGETYSSQHGADIDWFLYDCW